MRVRVLRGFVIGPGRFAAEGCVIDLEQPLAARMLAQKYVVVAAEETPRGPASEVATAHEVLTRDPKPHHRDPRSREHGSE
jgi:hypothetical protein